jgi:hypothetical protein
MTLDEKWERLAQYQPFADAGGFGSEWARMCEERTEDAAWEAVLTRIAQIRQHGGEVGGVAGGEGG